VPTHLRPSDWTRSILVPAEASALRVFRCSYPGAILTVFGRANSDRTGSVSKARSPPGSDRGRPPPSAAASGRAGGAPRKSARLSPRRHSSLGVEILNSARFQQCYAFPHRSLLVAISRFAISPRAFYPGLQVLAMPSRALHQVGAAHRICRAGVLALDAPALSLIAQPAGTTPGKEHKSSTFNRKMIKENSDPPAGGASWSRSSTLSSWPLLYISPTHFGPFLPLRPGCGLNRARGRW